MKRIKIGLERTVRDFVEVVVEVPDDFDEYGDKSELMRDLYYEFCGVLDWAPTKWYGDDFEIYDDVKTLTDDEQTEFVWDGKNIKEAQ
jgi:hypothetical protein